MCRSPPSTCEPVFAHTAVGGKFIEGKLPVRIFALADGESPLVHPVGGDTSLEGGDVKV